MDLDPDVCHRALAARDSRYDGLFFVGVSSTRIYCRPICPVKTPKRENCTFFASAAAAELAGYRPCLRCRPELAPGRANVDAVNVWAWRAAKRIEQGALNEMSVEELAGDLGLSSRQLRRAFQDRFGVAPIELAQTHRLLTAKRLLTDTDLSVGEVSEIAGFASLRRFNALFRERYRLAPTALRKAGRRGSPSRDIRCELGYRTPFSWDALLTFLGPRALPGVEQVEGRAYSRTVRRNGHEGWLSVEPRLDKPALIVTVSESLAPKLPSVLDRVRRLFDLGAEPEAITQALGPLAACHPGVRVPGAFDGFEIAVRAILGQQVSVKFAAELAGRFVNAFGGHIDTPIPSLSRTFPKAGEVAELRPDRIGELGIVRTRAGAILRLAQMIFDRTLRLEPGYDPDETGKLLKTIPGIGDWTAEYIKMRALSWPDAFPGGDLGVLKALELKSVKEADKVAEAWRPWRAYAVMHLWSHPNDLTT